MKLMFDVIFMLQRKFQQKKVRKSRYILMLHSEHFDDKFVSCVFDLSARFTPFASYWLGSVCRYSMMLNVKLKHDWLGIVLKQMNQISTYFFLSR